MICDAQVHAPAVPGRPERADPPVSWAGSIGLESLSAEMSAAGVDRAVLAPVDDRIDECLSWARNEPHKYAVVAALPPETSSLPLDQVRATISDLIDRGCRGVRASCFLAEDIEQFDRGKMNVIFEVVEELQVPLMFLAASRLERMGEVAAAFPGLNLCIDHMGIVPREKYHDFNPILEHLLPLAEHSNVVVKLTQIVRAVNEPFPYPSLHEPIRRVVAAFGAERSFWGSDFTVYPNPYLGCVQLFQVALAGLPSDQKDLVMGKSVCSWLSWD